MAGRGEEEDEGSRHAYIQLHEGGSEGDAGNGRNLSGPKRVKKWQEFKPFRCLRLVWTRTVARERQEPLDAPVK